MPNEGEANLEGPNPFMQPDNEIVLGKNRLDQVVIQGAENSDLVHHRDRMASAHATLELGKKELERLADAEAILDSAMREAIKGTPDEAKYAELTQRVAEARKVMQESGAMLKIDELGGLSEAIEARNQFVDSLWRKIRKAKYRSEANSNYDKLQGIIGDDRESWSAVENINLIYAGKKGTMTIAEATRLLSERWGEEAVMYAVECANCWAEFDKL
ncbi:MAG TPA: hypothetical protein VJK09_03005, partial [Candidatus Paceibacterota bacterium]